MSATIIQFIPKPNPNRDVLQRMAGVPANVEIAGTIIRGNPNVLEAHYPDTTQANAFHAPEKDPA